MRHHRSLRRRRGAAAVEFAFVGPVVLLLVIGLLVGGMGVFRYQSVAHLAREASRFAAVHGGLYEREMEQPAADEESVKNFVLSSASALDPKKVECEVRWLYPDKMPLRADPDSEPPGQRILVNKVTVTVRYEWLPEAFLIGPIPLSSTSEMPISY